MRNMFLLTRQFKFLNDVRLNGCISESIKKMLTTSCSLCCKEEFTGKNVSELNEISRKLTKAVTGIPQNENILYNKISTIATLDNFDSGYSSKGDIITQHDMLEKYSDKILALSEHFQCSEETSIRLLNKYPFLRKAKMEALIPKINTLLDSGVSREELISDLWILTYTIPTIERRLNLLKELNLTPIKPWLIRCSSHLLSRMARNRENNRIAMGPHKSVVDYLKGRLNMTDSQTKTFSMKHPPVMRVKVAKLKEMIDFLFSEGFTPSHIYHTPRVLCHSIITLQERLKTLRALNHEPHSLLVLCKTKRAFHKYLLGIKKMQKMNVS